MRLNCRVLNPKLGWVSWLSGVLGQSAAGACTSFALALAALTACGSDAAPRSVDEPGLRPQSDAGLAVLDRDHDGLCDTSELELGTDPDQLDSDGDGLPDIIELVAGHQPGVPEDPSAESLAHLQGERGATVELEARFTVEGDGEALSGWFSAEGTLYRDGDSADQYFVSSSALEAAPIDAARSIASAASRFEGVLGRTRLSFLLRFAYGDAPARDCARAYPFRYAIKPDSGDTRAEQSFLLVIGAAGASQAEAKSFCLPAGCD